MYLSTVVIKLVSVFAQTMQDFARTITYVCMCMCVCVCVCVQACVCMCACAIACVCEMMYCILLTA